MTRVYLTDKDYEILNRGDINEIKAHFNDVRGELDRTTQELRELKNTVKAAVRIPDPAARQCALREAVIQEP